MYNLKNSENVEKILSEAGVNVELVQKENLILDDNEFKEAKTFSNFRELNEYVNNYLASLKNNGVNKDE